MDRWPASLIKRNTLILRCGRSVLISRLAFVWELGEHRRVPPTALADGSVRKTAQLMSAGVLPTITIERRGWTSDFKRVAAAADAFFASEDQEEAELNVNLHIPLASIGNLA